MLGIDGFKTKKQLKETIKAGNLTTSCLIDTSLFGTQILTNGTVYVVGPDPYNRKWYAQLTVVGGKITKIK